MTERKPKKDDDQIERADEEAARASAAAEEAIEASDAGPEAEAAAEEATDAAAKAVEAAEETAAAPKPKRARKARAAEVAADEAEEAADEAKAAPKRKPRARPKAGDERSEAGKAAEPEAAAETAEVVAEPKAAKKPAAKKPAAKKPAAKKPAETATPARAQRSKRDQRRPIETGVTVSAHAKYVRTSARKARLVCDHIRGKDVAQARAILAYTPRAAAEDWAKLLESAVANAEHNHELVGEELRIAAVYADEGPTLKRYRPRAMGRATRIRKRTSHLTITLTPKEL